MNRRSALVLAVALAVVALLVGWIAFGLKPAPSTDPAVVDHGVAAADSNAAGTTLGALDKSPLEPTATAVERTRAEARGIDRDAPIDDSELSSAVWVEGRVELAEGTPMDEEVWVVAKGRTFERRPLHRARVGPDGHFRVAFQPTTQVGWLQLAARYNFLDEQGGIRPAKPPKDIVLKGRLGGAVRGRIVLPADVQDRANDVRHGRVSGGNQSFEFFGAPRIEGTILEDLRYEIGGLEPGAARSVKLKARGFVDVSLEDVEISPGAITQRDLVPLLGTCIAGRVLAADRTPVADARIKPRFDAKEGRGFTLEDDSVKSDAAGRFELVGLDGGDLSIVAQKNGFEPLVHKLGQTATGTRKTDLELVLSSGLAIAGHVKFADGRPGARAQVEAEDPPHTGSSSSDVAEVWQNRMAEREPVEAGADGAFSISGLSPGSYVITAKAWVDPEKDTETAPEETGDRARKVRKRGTPWSGRVESVAAGSGAVVVTLTKGDTIGGRALDSSGQPIERFTVHAEPDSSSPGYTSEIGSIERAFRDKDGRFALDGLRACGWHVHVSARGLLDSTPLTITVPGANTNLAFKLLRMAKLSGVVLDPERKPVEGAKISCAEDTASWRWSGTRATAKSNAKGEFTLVNAPLGAIRVHAEAPSFAMSVPLCFEIGPSAVRTGLELVLCKGGAIRGTVLKVDGSNDAGRPVNVSGGAGESDKNATSDAQGAFLFERLPPGRYTLVTSVSRDEMARMYSARRDPTAAADIDPYEQLRATVDVRDGETVTVALGGKRPPTIRMHGRIVAASLEGLQIAVAPLAEDGTDTVRHAQVAADGTYEVQLAARGSRKVTVMDAHSETLGVFRVDVPAGGDFERDFTLPGGRISGRIVKADKSGVGGLRVRALVGTHRDRLDDVNAHETRSANDGTFEFERLPDGTYTVETDGPEQWWRGDRPASNGGARVEHVVVKDAQAVKDIELVLREGGEVRGSVRNAAGDLMPGVAIFAFDASGHLFESNSTMESDSAARFTIPHAPEGRILLYARTPNSAGKASAVVRADEPVEVDIVLHPRANLSVLTQDASGAIVFSALEIVDEDGRHFEEVPPLSGIDDAPAGARAFCSIPAGAYTVRAFGTAGPIGEKRVRASEGARADVVLRATQ